MSEGCQRNWGPTRSADINILQRSDYFTDRCSFGLACGVLRLWCGGHLCCDSMVLLLLIGTINILESINLNPKLWALIVRQLHEVLAVLAFTDRNQRNNHNSKPLFLGKGGCGVWTSITCTIVFFLLGNIWVKSGYSS